MKNFKCILLSLAFVVAVTRPANAQSQNGQSPEEVISGFDARVEQTFRAESGKPLVRAASMRYKDGQLFNSSSTPSKDV